MRGDWKDWRPAIWLAMLGVAVLILVNPWYLSAICFGGAIGAAIRINQRRKRYFAAAAAGPPAKSSSSRQAPKRRRSR